MPDSFAYKEDEAYFDNLFIDYGGISSNMLLFDFRDPKIKRKEFNKVRHQVFRSLKAEFGPTCQLQCHQDCTNTADEVDHLIPLSSNVLNKSLRGLRAANGKKAPAQSFGSNHSKNFVLACNRCNAYKKDKIPTKKMIKHIFNSRNK